MPILEIFLIVLGLGAILLEIVLGAASGFDFLLVGTALVAGGVTGLATGNHVAALVVSGVLSTLYVAFGRRWIRARLKRRHVASNSDALLGRTVRVVESIAPGHAGRIRHDGEEWRALPAEPGGGPIEPGGWATVQRLEGVTVYVSPAASAAEGGSQ